MNATLVPRNEIQFVWPSVEQLLTKAAKRTKGRYEADDIFIDLLKGHQTLWIGFDDEKTIKWCATIAVCNYPSARVASLQYLGGNGFFDWFEEGYATLASYAKELGCERFEMLGRKGFSESIEKLGGKTIAYLYDFDLKET